MIARVHCKYEYACHTVLYKSTDLNDKVQTILLLREGVCEFEKSYPAHPEGQQILMHSHVQNKNIFYFDFCAHVHGLKKILH